MIKQQTDWHAYGLKDADLLCTVFFSCRGGSQTLSDAKSMMLEPHPPK